MKTPKVIIAAAIFAAVVPQISRAAELQRSTLAAWSEYLTGADSRMQSRIASKQPFLWMDDSGDRAARARRGEVIVAPVKANGMQGVPNGLIHDWIGVVFIPDATIDSLRAVLHDYDNYKQVFRPLVTKSETIACAEAKREFLMVWQTRALLVSVAMQGHYQAHDLRLDSHRGYTVSEATEVRDIAGYGHKNEHLLPPDTGNGFIWRIRSVARYEERENGVYLEVEAIVLTRDIPASLSWMVSPVVNHLSIQSLTTTLRQTREAVTSQRGSVEGLASRRSPAGASNTANNSGME